MTKENAEEIWGYLLEYLKSAKTAVITRYTNKQLEDMLEDVVNVLDLSDGIIEKHGPLGTPPAELVKLVLEQKDREIRLLKAGYPVLVRPQNDKP